MFVFLNGQFVPEQQAMVSVFDRGFLYGDGLFETVLVLNRIPFRWERHLDRLRRGAEVLRLRLPFPRERLRGFAEELLARNQIQDAILRLTLSRGTGPRGYSPAGADHPSMVMTLHPADPIGGPAPQWALITASCRLPAGDRLAQFKTCNKLAQILARAEADAAGAQEALLLNTDGFVVEGAGSNLFWCEGDAVVTPPLVSGILAGVTRSVVTELCHQTGIPLREDNVTANRLLEATGVFLSLSTKGLVEAVSLDRQPLARSPITHPLREAYLELLRAETSSS